MVNDHNFKDVADAIREAESKTSAEIVVTVVEQSGNYDHVPWILFCLMWVFALLLQVPQWVYLKFLPFEWSSYFGHLPVVIVLGAVSVGLFRFSAVKRFFTSQSAELRWVNLRAEVEFFEKLFGKTKDATGVLIFVSLVEHRAVVLADKSVFEKISKDVFESLMKNLLVGIKNQKLAESLRLAVEAVAKPLSVNFPAQTINDNEISNQVIFKKH